MSFGTHPRPVEDEKALAASATLMSVVSTIALASALGPLAGMEMVSGGAEVAPTDNLGIAAGGGIEISPDIQLG